MSTPYPASAARNYPPGKNLERRRITKCSEPGAWYKNMIGQTITVHYFCSFGAWDIQGRWLCFYDLSEPVNETNQVPKQKTESKTNWFKKLFK